MEFMREEAVVSTVNTTQKVLIVRNAKPDTTVPPMFLTINMMPACLVIVIPSDQSTMNVSKMTLLLSMGINPEIASVNLDSEVGDVRNVLQDSETTRHARDALVTKPEVSTSILVKKKTASVNRMSKENSATNVNLELSS